MALQEVDHTKCFNHMSPHEGPMGFDRFYNIFACKKHADELRYRFVEIEGASPVHFEYFKEV